MKKFGMILMLVVFMSGCRTATYTYNPPATFVAMENQMHERPIVRAIGKKIEYRPVIRAMGQDIESSLNSLNPCK